MGWKDTMYRQEDRAQKRAEDRMKKAGRQRNRMKVSLDNLEDRDGCVMATCDDQAAARWDQTISGAQWEIPSDMDIAYAMPLDHAGLVAELEKDGYELDTSEYCPPD